MALKDELKLHKQLKAGSPGLAKVEDIKSFFSGEIADTKIIRGAEADGRLISLPPANFRPDPEQPRKTFSDSSLELLKEDIESIGQLQPILVSPIGPDGIYNIIAGERRWRAISKSDTVGKIDAVVAASKPDEIIVLRMQIQENNNRDDINILDNAASIMRGVQLCKKNEPLTDDKSAAATLGLSPSSISKARVIMNSPVEIQALSIDGIIQDSDTLYELSKAFKKNHKLVNKFIADVRDGKVVGNVRKAAHDLGTALKVKKDDVKAKEPKKAAKKVMKTAVVADITFESLDDKTVAHLSIDNVDQSYILTDVALASLAKFFASKSES